ncbi:MAG: hypothetical protein EOP84_08035 [Verrucomicrobiaceae bacterium]|nr:MAG: hypothetical protein EOP84_08035 [Verrucomicrobiaceae bacterium]
MDVKPWVREYTHTTSKPDGYEYGFYVPFERDVRAWHDEIVPWVYERFGPQAEDVWFIRSEIIWFSEVDHAMEFKLRWL